jgi:hypothetical protein
VTVTTVMALTASLLAAGKPALAEETPAEPVDRARVAMIWKAGGVLVAPAAEQALLGSDDDVRTFLTHVEALQTIDDRITVNRIMAGGGPTVRQQAQQALDAGTVDEFLTSGWQQATHLDQRVRVNQMMAAGGTQLRAAAQKALDDAAAGPPNTDDMNEEPSGPLDTFIASGWRVPFETDQRIRVNQIFSAAPEKSNVRRLAQRALDAGNVDALTGFLDFGHAIAAARDEETNTLIDLVQTAQRAADEAVQLKETAKEEGAKATAAATAARTSAQAALEAMKDAGRNAEKAAAAARQAAAAADKAAKAAAQAMAAAQAAVAAARVAARAAARAAATAALTRRAANRANKAAADAAVNDKKSRTAKDAAKNALDAARLTKDAAAALAKTELVAEEAIKVGEAASAADQDADAAVKAAQEALALARQTGVNVAEAEAAARRARGQAARADRAAAAAITFARAAVAAARGARIAATEAAQDAIDAAKAATDAADHAGDASKAAQASTNAANSATRAANRGVTAANDAYAVYEAARAVDATRLTIAAEEGAEQAKAGLTAYQQYQRKVQWDAQEATKRDAETNRLIAEARDPATERTTAVAHARRVALALSTTGGPNTLQAALTALGGSDDDVLDFVRTIIDVAAVQDDRATLATLAVTGSDGMRAAADRALAGSDAHVAQFLRHQDYPERATEDRVAINQIMDEARKADNPVTVEQAQLALDRDAQARRTFLSTGQFTAAYADDRVAANRMLNDPESGPELKAGAQNALDGPPGSLHDFVTTGWHVAAQNDHDAATHDAEMLALLQRAHNAAHAATQNAKEAQAVAAKARGDEQKARDWAAQAINSANTALEFATKAKASAEQAERSADKAVASSKAAVSAAETANKAAERATWSAAAARASHRQALANADEAQKAARAARASAIAAGKNDLEARGYYLEAYKQHHKIIENQQRQQRDARQQQYYACLKDAGPFDVLINECSKALAPVDSSAIGKATLNKAFCNKFAQTDTTYYQNCVADTFNPNFMVNRAMDIMQAAAILVSQWGIFTMAGIGIGALSIGCAAVCAAAIGVAGGAEVSMGIGGLYTVWAEGALMSFVTGGTAAGFAGGRLLGGLNNSLGKIRLPGIFQRVTVPSKATDSNFARLMAKTFPRCLGRSGVGLAKANPGSCLNGGLGELIQVPKPDPAADKLAAKLGGRSRVKFKNDPSKREYDAISDLYIAQSKPGGLKLGSDFRNQAKATFEAAKITGRKPYFHFEGPPEPAVIRAIQRYAERYGIEPVIDISALG